MSTSPDLAFFALGPESSGTRLATEILINAGCHGSSDHIQPLDNSGFNLKSIPATTPVVWRRSFPHYNQIPKLADMIDRVYPRQAMAVITIRDWYCMAQSQLRGHQHATTLDQADRNISQAYEMIFTKLSYWKIPYRTLVYESIASGTPAQSSLAQARFLESLGLDVPATLINVYDGNLKYYEGIARS